MVAALEDGFHQAKQTGIFDLFSEQIEYGRHLHVVERLADVVNGQNEPFFDLNQPDEFR